MCQMAERQDTSLFHVQHSVILSEARRAESKDLQKSENVAGRKLSGEFGGFLDSLRSLGMTGRYWM